MAVPDLNLWTSTRRFPIAACSNCGMGRTLGLANEASVQSFYPPDYQCHREIAQGRELWLQRASWTMASVIGSLTYLRWSSPSSADFGVGGTGEGGSALDVGCGTGNLLSRLREVGWTASGIEPSRPAARIAKQRGFAIQEATIEEAVVREGEFDLVILHHSLEHTTSPDLAIAKCVRGLRERGIIAVIAPNFDSPGRRFFGEAWPPLEVPRHLYHFNEVALRSMLRRNGVAVEAVSFDNHLGDVLTGIRNMIRLRFGFPSDRSELPKPLLRDGVRRGALSNVLSSTLSAIYAPALRMAGLELRTSLLLLGRRKVTAGE